jgi:hypothetical protein
MPCRAGTQRRSRAEASLPGVDHTSPLTLSAENAVKAKSSFAFDPAPEIVPITYDHAQKLLGAGISFESCELGTDRFSYIDPYAVVMLFNR